VNLIARLKAAARTLWSGTLAEATAADVYGRPVSWMDLWTVNGRPLSPVHPIYGPETRKEKNATLRTLQDHDHARNRARVLAETNPNAAGLIDRLTAYNVGKGSTTEVQAVKEDAEPPKRLAAKVRDFLKEFKRVNNWTKREREFVRRLHVDGEFFLRFFPQKDGTTLVRFVNPAAIRPPTGEDAEGDWSFGIHTPNLGDDDDAGSDAEAPVAYCIHNFRESTDEIVEAQFILHAKINCLSDQKRGVPSLYAVEEELIGSAKLRWATREGEKNRACITYFRRHKAASESSVRAWQGAQAAAVMERPSDTGNQSQVYVERIEAGSVVDIPEGLDPLPPPSSPNSAAAGGSVQQALEAVAARFGVPYWIVSGDSAATNFAASLTAESPFTVTVQDTQSDLAELSDACQTKALEIGAEQALLPEDVLEQIDLIVSFPSPVSRNKKEESDRLKVLHDDSIISRAERTTQEGFDPEKQQAQIVEERAAEARQPPQPGPAPGANGAAQNGANGKAPSGTPAARYAQMTGALREGESRRREDSDEDDEDDEDPRLIEQNEWTAYEGKRGGKGWRNAKTGRIVYGERMPGGGRHAKAKADPAQAGGKLRALLADPSKLTPEAVRDAVEDVMSLTVPQINALKKELGVKASGPKAELAKKVAERALAKAGPRPADDAPPPQAEKPAAKKQAPPAAADPIDAVLDAYEAHAGGAAGRPEMLAKVKGIIDGLDGADRERVLDHVGVSDLDDPHGNLDDRLASALLSRQAGDDGRPPRPGAKAEASGPLPRHPAGAAALPDYSRPPAELKDVRKKVKARSVVTERDREVVTFSDFDGDPKAAADALRASGWDVISEGGIGGEPVVTAAPARKLPATPKAAYHLVPKKHLKAVLKDGLKPGGQAREGHQLAYGSGRVFLSGSEEGAEVWRSQLDAGTQTGAESKMVLIKVDLADAGVDAYKDQAGAVMDPTAFYLPGAGVPAARLSVVEKRP
jgi:hypothetical protein